MIEESPVLPANAQFFHDPVPTFKRGPYSGDLEQEQRWAKRIAWHQQARTDSSGVDLIFTDPDNGILFFTSRRWHEDPPTNTPIGTNSNPTSRPGRVWLHTIIWVGTKTISNRLKIAYAEYGSRLSRLGHPLSARNGPMRS